MSQSTSILLLGGAKSEASRLQRALSRQFLLVEVARTIDEACEIALRCRFDALVLVDPQVPWERMRNSLDACAALPPDVLVITERNRAQTAIDALRDGVAEVLLRPLPNDELVATLNRVIDARESGQGEAPAAAENAAGATIPVGELRSLIERLAPAPASDAVTAGYPLDWTLERVKRHHMARVLEASGGNKTVAARRLEVSRKTLERKLGTRNRD